MTPRRRQYESDNERQAAMRQRKKDEGLKRMCAWVPAETISMLKAIAASRGKTQEQIIEDLICKAHREMRVQE